MDELGIAQRLAIAAAAFESWRTGRSPDSAAVIIAGTKIVITMEGVMSVGETMVSKTSAGAAVIDEFHQLLFATTSHQLRQEIERITGVDVVQLDPSASTAGAIIPVFATGAVVLVIRLAEPLLAENWSGPIVSLGATDSH